MAQIHTFMAHRQTPQWSDAGMPGKPSVLTDAGASSGRYTAGVKTIGSAPQVGKWKKRLPTIVETECEEALDTVIRQLLLIGPVEPLAVIENPLLLADSHDIINVVIEKLKDACKAERSTIIAWLSKALPTLAASEVSSRLVQSVLDVATGLDRRVIASEFRGTVAHLCLSPYGHEVLIHLIENMPAREIEFMANEMLCRSTEIAKDRYGSRVLESLSMHCSIEQLAALEDELLKESVQLCRHPHGSSVLKHFLEYGSATYKEGIVQRLLPDMLLLSMHRIASHVIEKAFTHCESSNTREMVQTLLQAAQPISLEDVACSRRGSCILAEIADIGLCNSELRLKLLKSCPRLGGSKFGRKVIESYKLIPSICTDVGSHGGCCLAAAPA